jgi:hypothetical protein
MERCRDALGDEWNSCLAKAVEEAHLSVIQQLEQQTRQVAPHIQPSVIADLRILPNQHHELLGLPQY